MQAAAALDLHFVQGNGILNPGDLQALAFQRALLDLGPRQIGLVGKVRRPAVDGYGEQPRRRAAAAQLGLEIAGEFAGNRDHQRPEIILEKVPGGRWIAFVGRRGGVANPLPFGRSDALLATIGGDLAVGSAHQFGAGPAKRHHRPALPVLAPAGNLVERDRCHGHAIFARSAA